MRKLGISLALAALAIGPWSDVAIAEPSAPFVLPPLPTDTIVADMARPAPAQARPAPQVAVRDPCSCQTVHVRASNVVRDTDVESGDARMENVNLTYISADFVNNGRARVRVHQDAQAQSGDAVAGQILNVAATGRCSRVIVDAKNDVSDTWVESGDAEAINRNVILVDPGIDRSTVRVSVDRNGDVERSGPRAREAKVRIWVHQNAEASSGRVVAGQIIGVTGGGGPCGGVDVNAANNVRRTDLESGEATADNHNKIHYCSKAGCAEELARYGRRVPTVQVCGEAGCEAVPSKELAGPVPSPSPSPSPSASPTPTPTAPAAAEPSGSAGPSPSPTPSRSRFTPRRVN